MNGHFFRFGSLAFILAGIVVTMASSCVSHEELVSFQSLRADSLQQTTIEGYTNPEIQPEDLLRITVNSINPEAAAPFNIDPVDGGQRQSGNGQNAQQLELFSGYLVDVNGNIEFPILGTISVAGMTLEEVKGKLTEMLDPYLKTPVVNIRYLNLKVTVLGEVLQPGTVQITNKRVTLLEAIGRAGDLTQYANRANVLVIREERGLRTYTRLNLQRGDIFESPYYYLQQNDVIYVEPLPARVATVSDPAQRFVSYGTAALSLVSIIIAIATR
ncbi:polysaccharide export outer membrane protein [Lewinella marina]|nr:polysaccharide biosynthesis/export family protein [Neolewinella marina]NJB86683.1 polysaccharide export outer membrane protein [Neolewinella marina]